MEEEESDDESFGLGMSMGLATGNLALGLLAAEAMSEEEYDD